MAIARASIVVKEQTEALWNKIRDFSSHTSWIAGATAIEMLSGTGTTVGAIRRVIFDNGSGWDESLIALDDVARSMSYEILNDVTPLPMFEIRGRIQLHSITSDNTTLIEQILEYQSWLKPDEAKAFCDGRAVIFAKSLELLAHQYE